MKIVTSVLCCLYQLDVFPPGNLEEKMVRNLNVASGCWYPPREKQLPFHPKSLVQ